MRILWHGPMSVLQRALLRTRVHNKTDQAAVERLFELSKHDVRMMTLDRLVHGYVDMEDPTWLGYEYEVLYAGVVRRHWPEARETPVRALFIGGGSYTFQRHLLAMRGDDVRCVTAEIDAAAAGGPRVLVAPAAYTATVIELSRAFAVDGPHPGLCFVTFGGEEWGFHGSKALVVQLQSAGQLPEFMVNLDMTGVGSDVQVVGVTDDRSGE